MMGRARSREEGTEIKEKKGGWVKKGNKA